MKKEIEILYVEDNPGYVFLVKEILLSEKFIFRIENKDNLESAVEAVKKNDYKIIILDLGLPESKGTETFIEMKKYTNENPILVFSSSDDKFVINTLLKKGAKDYIVKGSEKMFAMNKKIENILLESVEQ